MKKLMKKNCEFCGSEFMGENRTGVCSIECRKKLFNKRKFDTKFEANKLKFENANPNSYVTCGVCGFKSGNISVHIKTHDISVTDYKKQYGNVVSQDAIDRVAGSNNPAYDHGGKFSPFSKKFVKYETLTEEEKNTTIADKFAENSRIMQENPENNSTRIEYYLAQGMDEKEAQEALSKRQSTFSLKICVEKYGEEEGRKVWQERQDKWMNTLDDKTDEEKQLINTKKNRFTKESYLARGFSEEESNKLLASAIDTRTMGYSKEAVNFIESFIPKEILEQSYYGNNEFYLFNDNNGTYKFYDFCYKNIIFEYHGSSFHPNYKILSEEELSRWSQTFSNKSSEIVKKYDDEKKQLAIDKGYEYFEIYSNDTNDDKDKVKQEILNRI